MAAIGGRLYVVGGVSPCAEELWVYDPATGRWDASGAPPAIPREHLASEMIDHRPYAVGVRGHAAGHRAALEIYEIFAPDPSCRYQAGCSWRP